MDMKHLLEIDKYKANSLALYNSERARGIVHTDEWKEKMNRIQAIYNTLTLEQVQELFR